MTETDAEKAQRLVDAHRVGIVGHNSRGTAAYVKGEDDIYTVNVFANGHFWCECAWGERHAYTKDLCAHALAVKLAVKEQQA